MKDEMGIKGEGGRGLGNEDGENGSWGLGSYGK